ncbi:syntaxin-8-like [Dendronephthya gigantea]|uniref:syntaxin-8-like n=1 Tax=Dendronephthya gigantea TaxID=151771 RepID=UPI00106DD23D|nr:syntaxin-8-like [Dendronephthya gigantea]
MAGDTWVTDCRSVETLGNDIMEKLNEKNRLKRSGSNYSKVDTQCRLMLQNYSKELQQLKSSLTRAASSYHITEREAERRQDMIDQLASKEKRLKAAFVQESVQTDYGRGSLLDTGPSRGFPSDPWSADVESDYTINKGVGELRQQQHQIIREQDKGLEALSEAIQRQKLIGHAISDEVDEHNEIIDDLHSSVENTNRRLIREDAHVRKVTAKSSSCVMMVVIVLLLITIVVVAAVPKKS